MNKNIAFVALIIVSGFELEACSFLRRYGANSYITNIPLFFKRQDPEAPKSKGVEHYETRETIIVKDNVEIEGDIEDTSTQTAPKKRLKRFDIKKGHR